MYQWLPDALQGSSTVITANRRLARVLQAEFARQQLLLNRVAWESPAIYSWQDWLSNQLQNADSQASLPTRLNPHQSQLLWERCLAREIGESVSGIAGIVRLARDAWTRMADWQVGIREVAKAARSDDHRLFAAAAGRYLGILEREGWVDEAGLGALVGNLITAGRSPCNAQITLVGFDRVNPLLGFIRAALADKGCDVRSAPAPDLADPVLLQCFETADAEMRAAGAWARAQLVESPGASVAIIAGNLEQDAERVAHLVREGLAPGWQYAQGNVAEAVNVSYGRRLIEFPAVSIALLVLAWLVRDLTSTEIGHLLRTPLLATHQLGGRSRIEQILRQMPDRRWSPAMVSSTFRGKDPGDGASEWLAVVARLTRARRELKGSASPAAWAVTIDDVLAACGWPGEDALSSFDFQLVNRWRDSLNDLARLELVSPSMTLKTALRRLEVMASDIVFQPESGGGRIQLMGPLEAAGAEFDAVWISGLTASNWPPAGNPSPLLSRQLQRSLGMPDADPADTVEYAERLLLRLGRSATAVVCSYARQVDDAEQSPTGLLGLLHARAHAPQADPGWHATQLAMSLEASPAPDRVPPIKKGERLSGGAGALQRQLQDPLSAFIVARLGVAQLRPQAIGLPASLRGNMIHDALRQLYIDTPTQRQIAAWTDEERLLRIDKTVEFAFVRHERNTDSVLRQLFKLERARVAGLLRQFIALDISREEFAISAVEHEVAFADADVHMKLRVDRIDRRRDGTLAILDYKTGARKTFLGGDGRPKEIQLVAYAMALDAEVSAVALVNIDAREMGFDGAGAGYGKVDDWAASLAEWKQLVHAACRDLGAGDVRINALQGTRDARELNLLSRYTELLRGE